MKIKQKFKNLKNSWSEKTQSFFGTSEKKKQEFSNFKGELKELKNLTPGAKETVMRIMKNSKVESKFSLPPKDALCAKITEYSYMQPDERPYQVDDFYLEPAYNSIFHGVYLNHKKKICIIGYRGTDTKEKADLLSDAQIILGVNAIDPRVRGSLEVYDQLRKSHPEYQKWICGHSLGGTLCYIVSKHRKVDHCCTFNPGTAPNKILILMLKDTLLKKPRTTKVHTYKILGDPISLLSYVGKTTNFFVPKLNPLKLHAMKNFLKEE